jgi:hypothetical protein
MRPEVVIHAGKSHMSVVSVRGAIVANLGEVDLDSGGWFVY